MGISAASMGTMLLLVRFNRAKRLKQSMPLLAPPQFLIQLQPYGVKTGALNRAVKRNIERFPADFMFQLTDAEEANLKCQIGISNADPANLRSQNAIAKNAESSSHGGRRTLPYAFTEQGAATAKSSSSNQKSKINNRHSTISPSPSPTAH